MLYLYHNYKTKYYETLFTTQKTAINICLFSIDLFNNTISKSMTLKEKFAKLFIKSRCTVEFEQIADEFAIGFAEWLLIIYNEDIIYDAYTKEELLEIYKIENNL